MEKSLINYGSIRITMRSGGPERPLLISYLLGAAGAEAVRVRTMLVEGALGEARDPIHGTYQRTKDVLDAVIAGIEPLQRIFGEGLTLPNEKVIRINPREYSGATLEALRRRIDDEEEIAELGRRLILEHLTGISDEGPAPTPEEESMPILDELERFRGHISKQAGTEERRAAGRFIEQWYRDIQEGRT